MTDPGFFAPLMYIPANRPGLEQFLFGPKSANIYSAAICLEDAIRPEDRWDALRMIGGWFHRLGQARAPRCYVRPASDEMLEALLEMPNVEHLAGIAVPKASPERLSRWLDLSCGRFTLLPILETRAALDRGGRRELAKLCGERRALIPRVRIGANDLLALLGGLRRPRARTIYETPLGRVIDALIEEFSSVGIPLCGCVFDRLDDVPTLARECRDDVSRGLFFKTALNPLQAMVILESYHPEPTEIAEAMQILSDAAPAVFALHGAMHEPAVHEKWARGILQRAEAFGVRSSVEAMEAQSVGAGCRVDSFRAAVQDVA